MELDDQTYDKIDAYLADRMRDEEKIAFEQEIDTNKTLKQEVLLQKRIKYIISKKNWPLQKVEEFDKKEISEITSYRNTEKFKNIQDSIKHAGNTYFEKTSTKKSRSWIYYLSGAAALLLILIGLKFSGNQSFPGLYDAYSNWDELPSFTVQGATNQQLAQGEALFREQKYKEALTIFLSAEQQHLEENTINPYLYLYTGISYLETDDTEKALQYFKKLEKSNTLDSTRAHWYKALLFLKKNEAEKAIKELQILAGETDGFKNAEAKKLLEKL